MTRLLLCTAAILTLSKSNRSDHAVRMGKFDFGQPPPPPTARRKKGVPNKFSADIKRWLTEAAEELGADGAGKDGGKGFVKSVGLTKGEALLAALPLMLGTGTGSFAAVARQARRVQSAC